MSHYIGGNSSNEMINTYLHELGLSSPHYAYDQDGYDHRNDGN